MKKLITIILLLPLFSYTQITVTHSNLPDIGDTIITAIDIATNPSFGNPGANQTWDFSAVSGPPEMLLGFIDPLVTPYSAFFPSSNISVKIDSATYYYLNRSI